MALDLSNSEAKIARANEHLESLYRVIAEVIRERPPYTTPAVLNKQGCFWSILLRSGDFKEPRLGVILGDFVHNLRSALDYVITALVTASHARLRQTHQFPIFTDGTNYTTRSEPYLVGITLGVDLIEKFQPFHRRPDPRLDPLFLVSHFSNSDKHRVISDFWPVLGLIKNSKISPREGIVRWEKFDPPMQWFPNDEREIFRVFYSPTVPLKITFYCEPSVDIRFGAARLGSPKQLAFPVVSFDEASKHVAMIVDTFKAL